MTNKPIRRLAFDLLDSTNAEALRLAADGERGPLWIDATAQSSGRGRSGRDWQSAPGNLLTSYLFSSPAPPEALAQLSLLAGVAVHQAVTDLAERGTDGLTLKWPNDLLFKGGKVGGILIETTRFGSQSVVVVGIGLNTASAPEIPGVETADLTPLLGQKTDLSAMRQALAVSLSAWLKTWKDGAGFDTVRKSWLKFGPPVGQRLSVVQDNETHVGTFVELDQNGSLCLLHVDGKKQCYRHGDVSVLSP